MSENIEIIRIKRVDLEEFEIDYIDRLCTLHMHYGSPAAGVVRAAYQLDVHEPGEFWFRLEIEATDGEVFEVGDGVFTTYSESSSGPMSAEFRYRPKRRLRGMSPGFTPIEIPEEATRTPGRFKLYDDTSPLSTNTIVQVRNDTGETIHRGDPVFDEPQKELIVKDIEIWLGGVKVKAFPDAKAEFDEMADAAKSFNGPSQARLDALRKATIDPVSIVEEPCPDCKGTGIYEGIISRGACEKCKGSGRA